MKRLVNILAIAALAGSLIGCAAKTSDDIQKVDFQGSYKHYESLDALVQAADAVAEIEVVEQKTDVLQDLPITTSTVKVRDVLKGNLTKGEVISVNELGGVYYPHLYGDPSLPRTDKPYEMTFEGVGAMKPKDRQIVFLVLDEERNDGSYTVFAMHQGKFKIAGDKADRGIHDESDAFRFESVVELKAKINQSKEKK